MTLFRPQRVNTSWQCERYFRIEPFDRPREARRLSIHKRSDHFEWYLGQGERYADTKSGRLQPAPDLETLLVLLCGCAVPVGVAADRLQEEGDPKLELVANFLREWENLDRYAKVVQPIMEKK